MILKLHSFSCSFTQLDTKHYQKHPVLFIFTCVGFIDQTSMEANIVS